MKSLSHILLTILFAGATMLLSACDFLFGNSAPSGGSTQSAITSLPTALTGQPNTRLLVLLDKSGSTMAFQKAFQEQGVENKLRGILQASLSQREDRLTIRYINNNTAGGPDAARVQISYPAEWDEPKQKYLDEQKRQNQIREYTNKERRKAIEQIRKCVTEVPASHNETNLWAALEAMARNFKDARPTDRRVAVFVSDMLEATKGGKQRNFEGQPPRSQAEAEQWAAADLARIREQYRFLAENPNVLNGAEVFVFHTLEANDPRHRNTNNVKRYWEKVFEGFGIAKVEFN